VDRETVIACYERVVATNPKVERKCDTMPKPTTRKKSSTKKR
jgi:hypothetical protein